MSAISGSHPEAYIGSGHYALYENGALVSASAHLGQNVDLGANVIVSGDTTVGDEVCIGPGARVTDSVLGDLVVIEEEAEVDHSTIEAEATIEESARVIKSNIGYGTTVGRSAEVRHTRMHNFCYIDEDSIVEASHLDIKTRVGKSSHLVNTIVDLNGCLEIRGRAIDIIRPVIIGDSVVSTNALIRNGVEVEDKVTIAERKGKTTVLDRGVTLTEGSYIKGGRKLKPNVVVVPMGQKIKTTRSGKQLSSGRFKIKKSNRRPRL